jgi:hypothetical protein
MNESSRWTLLLGCAVVAALELPRDAEVLAHDLTGPYCSCASPGGADARRVAAAGLETHSHALDAASLAATLRAGR